MRHLAVTGIEDSFGVPCASSQRGNSVASGMAAVPRSPGCAIEAQQSRTSGLPPQSVGSNVLRQRRGCLDFGISRACIRLVLPSQTRAAIPAACGNVRISGAKQTGNWRQTVASGYQFRCGCAPTTLHRFQFTGRETVTTPASFIMPDPDTVVKVAGLTERPVKRDQLNARQADAHTANTVAPRVFAGDATRWAKIQVSAGMPTASAGNNACRCTAAMEVRYDKTGLAP